MKTLGKVILLAAVFVIVLALLLQVGLAVLGVSLHLETDGAVYRVLAVALVAVLAALLLRELMWPLLRAFPDTREVLGEFEKSLASARLDYAVVYGLLLGGTATLGGMPATQLLFQTQQPSPAQIAICLGIALLGFILIDVVFGLSEKAFPRTGTK